MHDTAIVPLTGSTVDGVLIEVTVIDPEQDVAFEALDLDGLVAAVKGVASSFATALREAGPSKATIELGVTAGLDAGRLVAILGKASASSTLKLTLEWER